MAKNILTREEIQKFHHQVINFKSVSIFTKSTLKLKQVVNRPIQIHCTNEKTLIKSRKATRFSGELLGDHECRDGARGGRTAALRLIGQTADYWNSDSRLSAAPAAVTSQGSRLSSGQDGKTRHPNKVHPKIAKH